MTNDLIGMMESVLVGRKISKNDFHVDCESLRNWHSPSARWLWVIDNYGTHLVRLGVHEKESSWGHAVIGNYGESAEYYLLKGYSLKRISVKEAKAVLSQFDYTVRDGFIFKGEKRIASIQLNVQRPTIKENHYSAKAVVASIDNLSSDDITAIRYIALGESVRGSQSLFVGVREIIIDGEAIQDKLAMLRESLAA